MQVLYNLFFFFFQTIIYISSILIDSLTMKMVLLCVSNAMVAEVTFYCVRILESEKLRKIGGLCDVTKKRRTKRISRSSSSNNESSFIFFSFFRSSSHSTSGEYQTFLNFHFVLTNRILLISIRARDLKLQEQSRKVEKERLFPWKAVDHISNEIST